MTPLSAHLDRLTELLDLARRLPILLDQLAQVPPGGADAEEAAAIAEALTTLNVHQDGSSTDPTITPASHLEEALRSGAQPAAQALRRVAHVLLARLDRLASQGIRPPDSVLASDFGGRIIYLTDVDRPHLPPTCWGEFDALAEPHALRARIKRADCFEYDGRPYVFMGRAITGDMGSKSLPWIPIGVAINTTLTLSTPQRQSRKDRADQEKADQDRRRQEWEDTKGTHVRRVEAELAEANKKIAQMEAQLTAEAV